MRGTEPLTLKMSQGPNGWWYVIYEGDGTKPGSVTAGAGAFLDPRSCSDEALEALEREIIIRACEHDFRSWGGTGHYEKCVKCRIARGPGIEPRDGAVDDDD